MPNSLIVQLGIVVARQKLDHPWESERWRPHSVFLDPPETRGWRELVRGRDFVQYHAANVAVELHRKETAGYQVNLSNGEPSVYVILRETVAPNARFPVSVHTATLSPFEAQAHGYGSDEIVEGVAMPERLRALVEDFIAEHHREERFIKRRRDRSEREEPYLFGKEPIDVLRRRLDGREPGESQH
ncbi:MAG: DUF3305 domain-containing protein [Hyphomicrobiaceae bacterium]